MPQASDATAATGTGGSVLPPLNLSSGPAIAGGPTTSGPATSGNFSYSSPDWKQTLAKVLPVVIVAGGLWWLSKKR